METKPGQAYGIVVFTAAIILAFLFLVNFFNISYPISVSSRTVSGELSVVGEGKVDVVPDTATIQVLQLMTRQNIGRRQEIRQFRMRKNKHKNWQRIWVLNLEEL